GGQDLDRTLDFDLESGARPVPDQILQLYRITSPSHRPCRTARRFRLEFQEELAESRPWSREVLPEEPQSGEGSSQTSNQQISISWHPTGLGPKYIIETLIPLSIRLCPSEYRSLSLEGGNLALGPELSSLDRFTSGFGPCRIRRGKAARG
ncbi:MAG: hypothetical protein GY696_08265, partial [Gammaproteobacteria bacterium]|nr:hypothetical protein [Gammaproteobacteria bacterium]